MKSIGIYLLLCLSMLAISCGKKQTARDEFGESVLLTLLSKKQQIEYLFPLASDSSITDNWQMKLFIRERADTQNTFYHYYYKPIEIENWNRKANSLKMTKRNITFLRTEFDSTSQFYPDGPHLRVYFLINKVEYSFYLLNVDSLPNRWIALGISEPMNQSDFDEFSRKKRKELEMKPFVPEGLEINYANWQIASNEPEIFKHFYVRVENHTAYTFKRITFTVQINQNHPSQTSFNKTIVEKLTLYPGDVIRIEVDELRNFWAGYNVLNRDNWGWYGYIVDAKPRPGYEDVFSDD